MEFNGGHGLGVRTLGSIAWSKSTTKWNQGYASDLDNCLYDGYFVCSCRAAVAKPITLTSLVSEGNWYSGIVANSFGSITASGIDTRNSGGTGMHLNNAYEGATGTITLLGTLGENKFMSNRMAGLRAISNGAVTLNNLRVVSNGSAINEDYFAGIYVDTAGSLVITGGWIESNYTEGILVQNASTVNLNLLTVMKNGSNLFY